jgi:uncharacterized membrane protein
MTKLLLGVLLWSLTHLLPGALPGVKKSMVGRLGENGYKGIFTLAMVVAIYLIISGWKAAVPETVYLPPAWGRHLTALLVLLGFILFFAPYPPTNVKRLLRHPQLSGVALWGVGHLFANGESRSIVLFGGFAAWALLEMVLINRRDGAWDKPAPVPAKNDVILAGGGIIAYVVVVAVHEWLFGFAPFHI